MSISYQGITVVGGIVPPVLLGHIQSEEVQDPDSLRPASYHLAGGESTRDAASRAWGYLRGAWLAWREADRARGTTVAGTGAARDRWLLVLLRELGYGQVQVQARALDIDDRDYPISHEWNHVPIHLLGPGVDLDRRNPGVSGAARAPQAMVQEYLNRTPENLWGILSNGLQIRLLWDSTALAGSAYLEFDLETIFDGQLYPEFLLFWQLTQFSRLEKRGGPDAPAADCWLESWRGEAVKVGTRALDKLQDGVEEALVALGTGMLKHPHNGWLTTALHDGELTDRDFHKALLRTIYRMLFCFVAEDRQALLDPDAKPDAHQRYLAYFSTARLRQLSRRRAGGPHPDLWQTQRLVLRALGGHGRPEIAVPALGGLFDPDSRERTVTDQPDADLVLSTEIANQDLLTAVRALAWVNDAADRIQPVDYRHLGAEELGSVYESLLELIPRIDLADQTFTLERLSGNERKTTGSYYTPPALVSALLDSALDPVLDDAVKNADSSTHAEQRLLALTVCDPACGSGGFLVAAARRIARRVAQVRSGEDEPTLSDVQHALHDVVGRCVYGVDLNDLAAELAKVSLWLEALEPGKPLGFLDARIRVGNSLLGTTPALLAGGVPDAAFKEIEGDDKSFAASMRKRNKSERGQFTMSFDAGTDDTADLRRARQELLAGRDSNVDQVRAQARKWAGYEGSEELRQQRIHADAWSSAFMWPLVHETPLPPTDAVFHSIGETPDSAGLAATVAQIARLTSEYRFFHWHLEFPEIFGDFAAPDVGPEGWPGGFSCMLGNPPWEQIELKEKEFFAARAPEIAAAAGAQRKALVRSLPVTDPALSSLYESEKRRIDAVRHFTTSSGRYPLTGRGRVKTDPLFSELFRGLTNPNGRTGIIVPTGIATDATTQYFIDTVIQSSQLVALLGFYDRKQIFTGADVHGFCLLVAVGRSQQTPTAEFCFFVRAVSDLDISGVKYSLSPEEIAILNPNTGTVPIFRSRRDAEITLAIYRRVPILIKEKDAINGNPWGISFMQGLFNMTSDSHSFKMLDSLENEGWILRGNIFEKDDNRMLPLYEGKMFHQFDHRWATYHGIDTRDVTDQEKRDQCFAPLPRYWVPERLVYERLGSRSDNLYLAAFRDIARSTDGRTHIAAVLPIVAVGHTAPLVFSTGSLDLLLATWTSLVYDYVARQKVGGTHLTYTYVNQFAVLVPGIFESRCPWAAKDTTTAEWVRGLLGELTYTSCDMQTASADMGILGRPFLWDSQRRLLLRAELDAGFFHLYGVLRDDIDYILDTFSILADRDTVAYGEFRTKRVIIELFDAMQLAIDSGQPYQTILDPPPGQGARHPMKEHHV